jgi:hypothetical protein
VSLWDSMVWRVSELVEEARCRDNKDDIYWSILTIWRKQVPHLPPRNLSKTNLADMDADEDVADKER